MLDLPGVPESGGAWPELWGRGSRLLEMVGGASDGDARLTAVTKNDFLFIKMQIERKNIEKKKGNNTVAR